MSCFALVRFIETEGVSQQLHKIFHWLNGEGLHAHIRVFIGVKQGEQVNGRCRCVCLCMCGWGGRLVLLCHDSSA